MLHGLEAIFRARECRPAGPGAAGMTPSGRVIPFVKANACGNDFLIIDGVYVPADIADFSRRICDRHHGVGADGVEWLFPAPDADVQRAAVQRRWLGSGNFRQRHPLCGGLSLLRSRRKEKRSRSAPAPGSRTCTLISRSESQYEFETAMGEPQVGEELPDSAGIRRSARHSGLHGEPALRRLCEGVRPGMAGRGGRNRASSTTSSMGSTLSW